MTAPDPNDLAAIGDDIAQAKDKADLVFISFHWGDFMRPFHLTDHETRTAHWCIDQGVDMVIGHHHHALRGIEWYKGKPIFYGLSHLVFDTRIELSDEMKAQFEARGGDEEEDELSRDYTLRPRKGWPLLPLHSDSRLTMLAWAAADGQGVKDIGFVSCCMRPDGSVEAVDPESAEGRKVIAYVETCCTSQKIATRITSEGAPVIAGRRTVRVVPG